MTLLKAVPFQFEGKDYEIRVFEKDNGYFIRAYIDNKPANGYGYSVDEVTCVGLAHTKKLSALQHLIDHAQSDIENKVWEKYLAALEALKKGAYTKCESLTHGADSRIGISVVSSETWYYLPSNLPRQLGRAPGNGRVSAS